MDFHKGAFLSLLCNIPSIKIWRKYLERGYYYVGNLVYSLKSNLIASK